MALLPCLRWGDARWWIPLETATADALGQWILTTAADPPRAPAAQAAGVIQDRLAHDPALLIFASLRWLEAHPQRAASAVTPAGLARWLSDQWTDLFAAGDGVLGAPTVGPDQLRKWGELRRRCLAADRGDWLDGAAAWLEVAGPPVPVAWRASWPRIVFSTAEGPAGPANDDDRVQDSGSLGADGGQPPSADSPCGCGDAYPLAQMSLQALTRAVARQETLQQRFASRLHQEKLAALKQFAYGLSHEINNPLANIATRCQQLTRDEQDPQRVASLERVIDQAMRAHEMIADVMFFAHPPRPQTQAVCLADVVAEVAAEQREALAALSIELKVAVAAEDSSCQVTADAAMLTDALRALLRNASEAIGCGGRIDVSLRRRRRSLLVEVADSGPGLSESALRHAFDPYYSGREAGRGLGLGLCRVYRVAKLHRGGVTLAGGPVGCIARFWLPAW